MDRWTADQISDQSGRTFIVTGGNSGLGFETVRQLVAHGGRVLLATRSEARGRDAVARLKAEQPDADVEFRALDLADLDSVRPSRRRSRTTGSRWTCWSTTRG